MLIHNTPHANILLFQPKIVGFVIQVIGFRDEYKDSQRTFLVNFKRIGMREYRINTDGIAILQCTLEPNGRTLRTEICPFCGMNHIHGLNAGHKIAHCMQDIRIPLPNGDWVSNVNGYVLELTSNLEVARRKRGKILA